MSNSKASLQAQKKALALYLKLNALAASDTLPRWKVAPTEQAAALALASAQALVPVSGVALHELGASLTQCFCPTCRVELQERQDAAWEAHKRV